MKKKLISVGIIVVLLFISFEILTESSSILESMKFSMSTWANNIFPALFPFFIISNLLINYGFVEFLGEILRPLMYKLFKIKGEGGFVLALSMISGFPSNAKYTRELLENGSINEQEASKLLTFTHFSNPLFIMGTIALTFLNNKEVGLLILAVHYGTNLIIGLLFRNYYPSEKNTDKVSLRRALSKMHQKRMHNPNNFGQILTGAIQSTISKLLLILGVVALFLVLATIIGNTVHLDAYNSSILSGILEITGGLKKVAEIAIPLKNKAILSAFFISFGGISVHMQMVSIISDTKIKYFPFLVARILHGSIASLLIYVLFDFYITLF